MRQFPVVVALFFFAISSAGADELVRQVQVALRGQGYFSGPVDAEWGPQTSAAVRRFQQEAGLRVTGTLNSETLTSLGISGGAEPTPMPFAKAIAELFSGGPYLRAPTEFQVRTIRQAQENLSTLGYYRGPIDGNPSPQLTTALKTYQKAKRFRPTGRLDKTTLQALDLMTLPYPLY